MLRHTQFRFVKFYFSTRRKNIRFGEIGERIEIIAIIHFVITILKILCSAVPRYSYTYHVQRLQKINFTCFRITPFTVPFSPSLPLPPKFVREGRFIGMEYNIRVPVILMEKVSCAIW